MKKLLALLALLFIPISAHATGIEEIVGYIVEALVAAGVSEGAIIAVAYYVGTYGLLAATIALNVYGAASSRRKAAQQAAEARDKYNSNLIDRVSTLLQPNPPWRVVYGRCITGGDIVAIFTSSKNGTRSDGSTYTRPDAYKHLVIVVASHQSQAFNDILIDGIRVGQRDANGWAVSTSNGTGTGYTLAANYQVGSTVFGVAGGTGTILAGDEISFVGDATRYTVVTGITGPGQNITIASPGLVVFTPSGTAINLGNEFAKPGSVNQAVTLAPGASITLTEKVTQVLSSGYTTGDGDNRQYIPTTVNVSSDGLTITNADGSNSVDVTFLTSHFTSTVRVSTHLGAPGQTVDSFLNGMFPLQWDTSCTLSGMTYAVVTLDLEETRFQGGPPPISFDLSGALVLDPRTGTTAWSNNPALITRDFLTKEWGFACADSDVDNDYTIAAANACDVATVFSSIQADSSVLNRTMPLYTANGAFTTSDSPEAILTNLATSMAGTVAYGGQWLIIPGVWTVPVMDLTDDDIDGQISIVQAGAGLDTLFNGAHASYLGAGRTSPSDIVPYQNPTFLAADGEELWSDYTLPFTDDEVRARNLCRIFVERNRNGLIIQYPAKLKAWPLRVGSRVRVSSTEYGFVSKYFRVTDWQFGISSTVNLTLEEDDPAAYDQADATMVDPTPNTKLPNPYVVGPITNLQAVSGTSTLQKMRDGTIVPRVKVTWNASGAPYMTTDSSVEIAWQVVGDSSWTLISCEANEVSTYILGVSEITIIIIRAVAINSLGVRGKPSYISHLVLGKSVPPGNVTGFNVSVVASNVLIKWDANHEADYLETEVHLETTWNDATSPIFLGSADRFTLPYPVAGTYHFTAKHRDTSGNLSNTAATFSIDVPTAPSGTGTAATWTTISGIPANIAAAGADGGDILNSHLTSSIAAAQAAADAANTALTAFASDNILSKGEKPAVILDWNVISGEQSGILAEADSYGITTERTAYNNAVTTLGAYLVSLTPGWSDTTSDTPIDGPTFRNNFAAVYSARQTLLNAISTLAGTTAVWTTVRNAPADANNLVLTPTFNNGRRTWPLPAAVVNVTGQQWAKALRVSTRDTIETTVSGVGFPVRGGERLYVAADIKSLSTSYAVSFGLVGYDKAGSVIFYTPGVTVGPGADWTHVTGVIDTPANTVSAAPWLQINGSSGFGTADVTNLYISRYAQGATRNTVYYQATAPAGTEGDLWFNTTANNWSTYTGGAWQVVSDVTASKIAAGIAGQGALATLNAADTAQITPGAVTATVETNAAGPVSDVGASPTEIVRVSFGPYSVATTVDITFTGYCNYKYNSSFSGPLRDYIFALLSDSVAGDGATQKSQASNGQDSNAPFSFSRTVSLPASTSGFARLLTPGNYQGGGDGYANWYGMNLKAVVRKR